MMTRNTQERIVIIGVMLVVMIMVVGMTEIILAPPTDPCMIDTNSRAIYGRIASNIGTFSRGPLIYYLSYEGKRKITGEVCIREMIVTEKEYGCHMYGE